MPLLNLGVPKGYTSGELLKKGGKVAILCQKRKKRQYSLTSGLVRS